MYFDTALKAIKTAEDNNSKEEKSAESFTDPVAKKN